jgi:hypothetical protein
MTTARDAIAETVGEFMSAADRAYRGNVQCADMILARLRSAPDSVRLELAALFNPWRPIETAPKDGTPLVLFSPYDADLNCKGGLIWVSGGWRVDRSGWRGDHAKEPPTHWLPLPAPPSENKT